MAIDPESWASIPSGVVTVRAGKRMSYLSKWLSDAILDLQS